MRPKVAAAVGAVVVVVLAVAGIVIFSGGEQPAPASLSVPAPTEYPELTPSRTQTAVSIIPPAQIPAAEQPPSSTPSSTAPPARTVAPPPAQQPPAPTPVPNAFGRIGFFGARTNSPPGSREIAFRNVLHGQAGGTGTFDDPLTFAAGRDRFKPGTKIYVPDVKRYFILEDLCPRCSGTDITLWAGPANDSGLMDCIRSLSRSGDRGYVLNPPSGFTVVPGDLYQSGRCFRP